MVIEHNKTTKVCIKTDHMKWCNSIVETYCYLWNNSVWDVAFINGTFAVVKLRGLMEGRYVTSLQDNFWAIHFTSCCSIISWLNEIFWQTIEHVMVTFRWCCCWQETYELYLPWLKNILSNNDICNVQCRHTAVISLIFPTKAIAADNCTWYTGVGWTPSF